MITLKEKQAEVNSAHAELMAATRKHDKLSEELRIIKDAVSPINVAWRYADELIEAICSGTDNHGERVFDIGHFIMSDGLHIHSFTVIYLDGMYSLFDESNTMIGQSQFMTPVVYKAVFSALLIRIEEINKSIASKYK